MGSVLLCTTLSLTPTQENYVFSLGIGVLVKLCKVALKFLYIGIFNFPTLKLRSFHARRFFNVESAQLQREKLFQ